MSNPRGRKKSSIAGCLENKEAINAKIKCGLDQLDQGEGIPEDQLDAYLAKLKIRPE
jgi:predicted transcriptional regulator